MIKANKTALIIFGFALFFLACFICVSRSHAQNATSTPATDATSLQEQADLQRQLQEIEAQIAQYQNELKSIQGEKNTLQNKLKQLQKQQTTLNLQIRATNLQITSLAGQITKTQNAIDQNIIKSDRLKAQIAKLVQLIYERDSEPLLFFLFASDDMSDIFTEIENYAQVSQNLSSLLDQTKATNEQLNLQQETLSDQRDDAKNLLSIQSLQKQGLSDSVNQQNGLLTQTKGKESNYQSVISDTQKQARVIRERLYQLLGVTNEITFGEAVKIAQWASAQSGVRPAFLLAVLTQESNIGKNVGTCNRPGDPPSKSWKVVMNPTRDQPYFLQITQELGMDTDITPISCPMRDSRGRQIGWGGAMGPAQFIPSTWMGYRDKVSALTGKTADPWDIRDAFLAAALKLAAGGATTQSNEWTAAMRYFSGSTSTKYRFYGDSVVAQAAKYQSDIDELNTI